MLQAREINFLEQDLEAFDDTVGNHVDVCLVLNKLQDASQAGPDALCAMVETLREENKGDVIDCLLRYSQEEPELEDSQELIPES